MILFSVRLNFISPNGYQKQYFHEWLLMNTKTCIFTTATRENTAFGIHSVT